MSHSNLTFCYCLQSLWRRSSRPHQSSSALIKSSTIVKATSMRTVVKVDNSIELTLSKKSLRSENRSAEYISRTTREMFIAGICINFQVYYALKSKGYHSRQTNKQRRPILNPFRTKIRNLDTTVRDGGNNIMKLWWKKQYLQAERATKSTAREAMNGVMLPSTLNHRVKLESLCSRGLELCTDKVKHNQRYTWLPKFYNDVTRTSTSRMETALLLDMNTRAAFSSYNETIEVCHWKEA